MHTVIFKMLINFAVVDCLLYHLHIFCFFLILIFSNILLGYLHFWQSTLFVFFVHHQLPSKFNLMKLSQQTGFEHALRLFSFICSIFDFSDAARENTLTYLLQQCHCTVNTICCGPTHCVLALFTCPHKHKCPHKCSVRAFQYVGALKGSQYSTQHAYLC